MQSRVDTLITVSNDKLLEIVPDTFPVTDAFLVADAALRDGKPWGLDEGVMWLFLCRRCILLSVAWVPA
jgi:hypothetical protein